MESNAGKTFFFSTERPLQEGLVEVALIGEIPLTGRSGYFFESKTTIDEYGTGRLLLVPKAIGDTWPPKDADRPLFVYVFDGSAFDINDPPSEKDLRRKEKDWGGLASLDVARKWWNW